MTKLLILFFIIIGVMILFRRRRQKSDASIHYKPYDAMNNGTGDHITTDSLNDSKHHIQYEEKSENTKG